MGTRRYSQLCGLASALDVVGERWALLIVRDLLAGPRRYTDLAAGLPGISTDMLAARLKTLERRGVLARRVLPPPAASAVYELTPLGRALEPALVALGRWGLHFVDAGEDATFRIEWLALMLRAAFRPERARGDRLRLDLRAEGQRLQLVVDGAELATELAPSAPADVTAVADLGTLIELARDPTTALGAVSAGRLRLDGRPEHIGRLVELFGLSPEAPP